jgi:pyruvate dehydrogenase E2 component (dihydrolipoamide acetyltransferase)
MAVEMKLPSLGEGIKSADVVSILVSVGDTIEAEQDVIELETDKATIPVPSPAAGKVKSIDIAEGDSVKPGQLILVIEESAGNGKAEAPKAEKKAEPKAEAPKAEAKAAEPEPEAEPEEPKSTPAPQKAAAAAAPAVDPAAPIQAVPAPPSVRRFAREIGIDIHGVAGSGPGGRISLEDVKSYAKALNLGRVAGPAGAPAAQPLPDFSKWGDVEVEPMSNIRKATANHMANCWATVPHVTQFDKADATALDEARAKYAKMAEKAGAKITPTAVIIKVVAEALKRFPQFNASVDMATMTVVKKSYISIGCAVDTERGLVVPVIRDADKKTILQIAKELGEIAGKARDRKLGLEDMQGGTFTVSNLGGIGGTNFTPIVNSPEVAILGVARGGMEPVWDGTAFVPRSMMPLSLSYDHRVIDGADGARFLRWICAALEDPFLLSL